jgi:hypothetical protein
MQVRCPTCDRAHYFGPDVTGEDASGEELMLCRPEDGGCGRFFAVFWTTSVLAKVVALVEKGEG